MWSSWRVCNMYWHWRRTLTIGLRRMQSGVLFQTDTWSATWVTWSCVSECCLLFVAKLWFLWLYAKLLMWNLLWPIDLILYWKVFTARYDHVRYDNVRTLFCRTLTLCKLLTTQPLFIFDILLLCLSIRQLMLSLHLFDFTK